ncbi:MAG: pyridoxamine 5'-phosphate oxidase family protein [Alphaproteobacteria bacterium]|nr:pyridoxamine 5'-phosphate oxidase family protein [Alphaproteobacteria bacterium]
MNASRLYHAGSRTLQDRFGSRALADRLEQKTLRASFNDTDRAFIASAVYFFLATADEHGHPECSFKRGPTGFVRVTGPAELAFPDYDGNGMFKSLGNLALNPEVGLLFIALHDKPQRLRVNGTAVVREDDPLLAVTPGAQLIVRVTARAIFSNCPRYLPSLSLMGPSPYWPKEDAAPVEPSWKSDSALSDCVPPRRR